MRMVPYGVTFLTLIIISSGKQFGEDPTMIKNDDVKNIHIDCTTTTDRTLALTQQSRILFSDSTDRTLSDLLGLVDYVFGLYNSPGALVSGQVIGNRSSRIILTWNFLEPDRTGVYKCEIRENSFDADQKNDTVTTAAPNQVNFSEVIRNITRDLVELKASLVQERLYHSKLNGMLEKGKSKFFRVSHVFQGRRYYLSAGSNILVTEDAEAMCEIFGGYLVEIDSAEENDFIVTFLRRFPQYKIVLTGGSDEILENRWINTYSKTPVKYINWYPGEPNNRPGENCLYFWSDAGWKMNDYICNKGLVEYISAYLCEIPE